MKFLGIKENSPAKNLSFALEKLTNLALVNVRKGESETIKEIVDKLDSYFFKIFEFKNNSPEKYERLLKRIYPADKNLGDAGKTVEENESNKLLGRTWEESNLISIFLEVYENIWRECVAQKNENISRLIVERLISVLGKLTIEPGNKDTVNKFLWLFHRMTWDLLVKNKERPINGSIYLLLDEWFSETYFSWKKDKQSFLHCNYLADFRGFLFRNLQICIDQNEIDLIKNFLWSVHSRFQYPYYNSQELWNLSTHFIRIDNEKYKAIDERNNIRGKLDLLISRQGKIDDFDKLEAWLKDYSEFKSILLQGFKNGADEDFKSIDEDIIQYSISHLIYQNILELVFSLGAYCLFGEQKKPKIIKEMWEFKQPPDADSINVGHDVVPQTLSDLIKLYFNNSLLNQSHRFSRDHHGSSKYYKQYFLICIFREVRKINSKANAVYTNDFIGFNSYELSSFGYSIDNLIVVLESLWEELSQVLVVLEFNLEEYERLKETFILPLFVELKEGAVKQLELLENETKVSLEKVESYKRDFIASFWGESRIRGLFKNFGLYDDQTNIEVYGEKKLYGFSNVVPKYNFFDDWYISGSEISKHDGESLANQEDIKLAKQLSDKCQNISIEDLSKRIEKSENISDWIIISANNILDSVFMNRLDFVSKWDKQCPKIDLKGFSGVYRIQDASIPIIDIHGYGIDKAIIILNTNKLGELVQLNPIQEEKEKKYLRNIFYLNIQAYSENEELLEGILSNPPKWLVEKGDRKAQESYLNKRALIQILEKFELRFKDNFEGYLITNLE